jgi:hypothetical protein
MTSLSNPFHLDLDLTPVENHIITCFRWLQITSTQNVQRDARKQPEDRVYLPRLTDTNFPLSIC